MAVILIGQDSGDRSGNLTGYYTYIDTEHPADGSGVLTDIHFRINTNGITVKLGTFKYMGNGVYQCRDSVTLGARSSGLNTETGLSLQVMAGDYLGIDLPEGYMDYSNSEAGSYAWINARACVPGEFFARAGQNTNQVITLGGSGVTVALGDLDEEIRAELDDVLANYVPTVNDWLNTNYNYLSFFNIIAALFAKTAIGIGEAGGGGATLAQMEALMGTTSAAPVVGEIDALQTIINTEYAALLQEHADTQTALGVTEGNLDAAVTAAKVNVLDAISAIDAATSAEVASAVTTLQGDITSAQNAVAGVVATEAAAVTSSVNGNVDLEVGLLSAAISALNNLSEAAVQAVVNAAVATLTGEVGEAADAVLAALAALPLSTAGDRRFPGLDSVTLAEPVLVSTPTLVNAAMDGCLITIASMPGGTGRHEVGSYTSWQHGGWVCFVGPDGYADELQWLNLSTAAYCPKRVRSATSALIFPRAGASVQVTPYTLDA